MTSMNKPKFQAGDRVRLSEKGRLYLECGRKDGTVVSVGVDDRYVKVLFDSQKRAQYYDSEWFEKWRME